MLQHTCIDPAIQSARVTDSGRHIGAIFQMVSGELTKLDAIQDKFLRELGVTEVEAFLSFNLAPLAYGGISGCSV